MDQYTYLEIITEQTERALWEVRSIIDSVPMNYGRKTTARC